jgi:hypothetical protein
MICATECGVSECDSETSIMRRPWPTRRCCAMHKKGSFSCDGSFFRRRTSLLLRWLLVCVMVSNLSYKHFMSSEWFIDIFFPLWRCGPTQTMASSFLRFLDHTQRLTTVDRTPLDERPARRRDPCLTKHNNHNRHACLRRDSTSQSRQASGRRPTP